MVLVALLLAGCAAKKPAARTYATPECIRMKEDCEIKDGKLAKGCKFVVDCTKIVKQ